MRKIILKNRTCQEPNFTKKTQFYANNILKQNKDAISGALLKIQYDSYCMSILKLNVKRALDRASWIYLNHQILLNEQQLKNAAKDNSRMKAKKTIPVKPEG